MSLNDKIEEDFKKALKAREEIRVSTFRMLRSALQYSQKEQKQDTLNDDQIIKIISTLCKQRREAIEQFRKGEREDLAQKEEKELAILQEYLPAQLSSEELESVIADVIQELGATSAKEMGQVMKAVMAKVSGRADGSVVNQIVRAKLS